MLEYQAGQVLVGYNPSTNHDEEGIIQSIPRKIQVKDQLIAGDFLLLLSKDNTVLTNESLQRYNDKHWGELYKTKNNLLTADQLKNIREKRHLTQEGLAKFLEIGKKDIARYENGAIQTRVIDLLLRLIDDDASFVQMSRVFKEASTH